MPTYIELRCSDCNGTGFVKSKVTKIYCTNCNNNNMKCYYCENIKYRNCTYQLCSRCDSSGTITSTTNEITNKIHKV